MINPWLLAFAAALLWAASLLAFGWVPLTGSLLGASVGLVTLGVFLDRRRS